MTNMKRSLSDSESDGEFDDIKDGSPSQSCGVTDRKKRRGIIEKRRRDRINHSLSELRRLVPTAFEKQGSAKLEKAEILQMTVDHLKVLHQKGLNGYNIDPTALAMDYRSVGFRECAAEVARYLVTVEGMDIQDPLRLRLMSHLQCYSAQREAAAKASLGSNSWNSMPPHHSLQSQYNSSVSSMPPHHSSMISQHQQDQLLASHPAGLSSVSCTDSRLSQHDSGHMTSMSSVRLPTTASVAPQVPSVSTTVSSQVPTSVLHHSQFPGVHSQFSLSVNSMPMLSPSGTHSYSPSAASALTQSSVKPYRPWGAELAY